MRHQSCANCGAPGTVPFKGETFRISHKGVSAEVTGLSGWRPDLLEELTKSLQFCNADLQNCQERLFCAHSEADRFP